MSTARRLSSFRPRNRLSAPRIIASSRRDRPCSVAQRVVFDRLDAKAQAGERRAQVVRHRGEHACAAVEIASQALLHRVECASRGAQFARAALSAAVRRCAPRPTASAALASSPSGRVIVRVIAYSTAPSTSVRMPSSIKICAAAADPARGATCGRRLRRHRAVRSRRTCARRTDGRSGRGRRRPSGRLRLTARAAIADHDRWASDRRCAGLDTR